MVVGVLFFLVLIGAGLAVERKYVFINATDINAIGDVNLGGGLVASWVDANAVFANFFVARNYIDANFLMNANVNGDLNVSGHFNSPDLNANFVPYFGATKDVNLGVNDLNFGAPSLGSIGWSPYNCGGATDCYSKITDNGFGVFVTSRDRYGGDSNWGLVNGTFVVKPHFLNSYFESNVSPTIDNTFDLGESSGSSVRRWKGLYLSGDLNVAGKMVSPDLNANFVPYIGATKDVNLGNHDLNIGRDFRIDNNFVSTNSIRGYFGIGTVMPLYRLQQTGDSSGYSTADVSWALYDTNPAASTRNWRFVTAATGAGIFELQRSAVAGGAPTTTSWATDSSGNFAVGGGMPYFGMLDVYGTGATGQMSLHYTRGSVYSQFNVDSGGKLNIATTGGTIAFGDNNVSTNKTVFARDLNATNDANIGRDLNVGRDINAARQITGLNIVVKQDLNVSGQFHSADLNANFVPYIGATKDVNLNFHDLNSRFLGASQVWSTSKGQSIWLDASIPSYNIPAIVSSYDGIYMAPAGNLVGYFSSGTAFGAYNDKPFRWGTSGTPGTFGEIRYSTVQTNDTLLLNMPQDANAFIIAATNTRTYDFAHPPQANPTVFVHSKAQSTNQWLGLTHDGNRGVISTGAGDLNLSTPVGTGTRISGYATVGVDTNAGMQKGDLNVGRDINAAGQLRIGKDSNRLIIDANGIISLGHTVWDDLRVAASATQKNPVTSKPDYIAFIGRTFAFSFDPDTNEGVNFTVQLPHNYKEGTSIIPHVHWSPSSAAGGNVVWSIECSWANMDATFPATETYNVTVPADGTIYGHDVAYFLALNGTGKTISSMLNCSLNRGASMAADTYVNEVWLQEIDFHYQIDSLGSTLELVK
jgi:hypothetical protein